MEPKTDMDAKSLIEPVIGKTVVAASVAETKHSTEISRAQEQEIEYRNDEGAPYQYVGE